MPIAHSLVNISIMCNKKKNIGALKIHKHFRVRPCQSLALALYKANSAARPKDFRILYLV